MPLDQQPGGAPPPAPPQQPGGAPPQAPPQGGAPGGGGQPGMRGIPPQFQRFIQPGNQMQQALLQRIDRTPPQMLQVLYSFTPQQIALLKMWMPEVAFMFDAIMAKKAQGGGAAPGATPPGGGAVPPPQGAQPPQGGAPAPQQSGGLPRPQTNLGRM